MNRRSLSRFIVSLSAVLLVCSCASKTKRIDCEGRLQPINAPSVTPTQPPARVEP